MKNCCWASAKLRPGLAKAVAGSLPMYASLMFRSWRAKITLVMKKYTAKAILQHTQHRVDRTMMKTKIASLLFNSVDPAERLFS